VESASTIASPYKIFDSSGNPNEIGDFSSSALGQDTGTFDTRHMRRGNASGIGGSFLGTTNVTSESSPARSGRISENAVRALIPTPGVNQVRTRLYFESLTEPASTALPEMSPDISNRWNPALPSLNGGPPSSPIDFFAGHKYSPGTKTFSETVGAPSFDSY
jgi:hypothetical protein